MSCLPDDDTRTIIPLRVERIPEVCVYDLDGPREATSQDILAHILASQLRVEAMVADAVEKISPTIDSLGKNPILSRMFGM